MTALKILRLTLILLSLGSISCAQTAEIHSEATVTSSPTSTQSAAPTAQLIPSISSTLPPLVTETIIAETTLSSAESLPKQNPSLPAPTLAPRGTKPSQIFLIEFPTPTPFTTATAPAVFSPFEPPAPLPTSAPYETPQPTRTSKPTATRDAPSFAQRTGDSGIDYILEVLQARDKEALRTLIQFTAFKCTNVGGIGGPPKCWGVGGKRFDPPLPEGTELELLPLRAPIDWPLLETIDPTLDEILGYPALEAVYNTETNSYLRSEEGWPMSRTAIVLSHGESQIALLVKDGRIVIIDFPDERGNWSHTMGDYLIPPQP